MMSLTASNKIYCAKWPIYRIGQRRYVNMRQMHVHFPRTMHPTYSPTINNRKI
jgi:hypothetical protein